MTVNVSGLVSEHNIVKSQAWLKNYIFIMEQILELLEIRNIRIYIGHGMIIFLLEKITLTAV